MVTAFFIAYFVALFFYIALVFCLYVPDLLRLIASARLWLILRRREVVARRTFRMIEQNCMEALKGFDL